MAEILTGLKSAEEFRSLFGNCIYSPTTDYGVFGENFSQGCVVKFDPSVVGDNFTPEVKEALTSGVVMKYQTVTPHAVVIMTYYYLYIPGDFGRTGRKLYACLPGPEALKLLQSGKMSIIETLPAQ